MSTTTPTTTPAALSPAASTPAASAPKRSAITLDLTLNTIAAWALGICWLAPLLYTIWTAFHPSEYSASFSSITFVPHGQPRHFPNTSSTPAYS